eukprot:scaffold14622_cov132-Isochrysis_galbana.AAC.7
MTDIIIDKWHFKWQVVCMNEPPHDNPSSLIDGRGIQFLITETSTLHHSQAQKVARQGRHKKSAGKRNHIIIIDEVEYHVSRAGPSHTYPFRGHEVACRLLQPLWAVYPSGY